MEVPIRFKKRQIRMEMKLFGTVRTLSSVCEMLRCANYDELTLSRVRRLP